MAKQKRKQYSAAEKKSFFAGLFAGLCRNKKNSTKGQNGKARKKRKFTVPNGPTYLGRTYVNGKFYDTNWKTPVEITKEQIKDLRSEYDFDGKRTDAEIVDSFVHHMRRKYGTYDENDNFIGMLGDK